MTIRKQVERALLDQMRDHGGTLTVEKDNRLLHYTYTVLNEMAESGRIELAAEDTRTVTYRLVLYHQDLRPSQPVLWQYKRTAIPATVVHTTPQQVMILVRDATGEEKIHVVQPSTPLPLDDQP